MNVFEKIANLQARLSKFGHMNRANRMYFQILLFDQAKELGLSPARLSGYEVGRESVPESVIEQVRKYWSEKFTKHGDCHG